MKYKILKELQTIGCIKRGEFVLKSGLKSNLYFDLRKVISYPKLLNKIVEQIYLNVENTDFVIGVPYAGIPYASALCSSYNIPMLFLVGWRGEPYKKDEPQHLVQGELTEKILQSLNINYSILPDHIEYCEYIVEDAIKYIKNTNKPYVLLVKRQTFEKYLPINSDLKNINPKKLNRYEVLETIEKQYQDDKCYYILVALREHVKEGKPLTVAMEAFPSSFPYLYCSIVGAGESVGDIGDSLGKAYELYHQKQKMQSTEYWCEVLC